MNKPFLEVFESRRPISSPPPIWLMRQAGRYLPEYRELRARVSEFKELFNTPELAVKITLQPVHRFGLDAAIIFSDILFLPVALGQELHFEKNERPKLLPAIGGAGDLARLRDNISHVPHKPTLEALSLVRARLPSTTSLIGFAGAPWTLATYMTRGEKRGEPQGEAKLFYYRDSKTFVALLELLVEATISSLSAQVEAGAEAVQIFESWAGDLPEDVFRQCSLEPVSRIAKSLRGSFPNLPILFFSKGSGVLQRLYATDTELSGISIDSATPRQWARRVIQKHKVIQGNLDPYLLVTGGEKMDQQIDDILTDLGQGPFIFNLGHGVLPMTPPENVARLVERVRKGRTS